MAPALHRLIPPHATTWADATIPPSNNTVRGYTGHEQLDLVGLIHMNGRVHDPTIGRFTSADPIIQIPDNPQAYNRCSYVLNNPLSFTDPTGFFLDFIGDIFEGIADFISDVIDFVVDNIRTIAAITAAAAGQWYITHFALVGAAANTATFASGFASGLISSDGDIGDSFIAGATALGASAVGPTGNIGSAGWAEKTVTHGLVGGLSSVARGGDFGSAFLASGVSAAVQAPVHGLIGDDLGLNTVAHAVIGGTASEIAGGDFANGAVTGSFSYAAQSGGRGLDQRMAADAEIGLGTLADNSCPAGTLTCSARSFADPLGGYGNRTTIFGSKETVKWGRYDCFGNGGACSFVGPGSGENLYGVKEYKRWAVDNYGNFQPSIEQNIGPFSVDPSSWIDRHRYGPEFFESIHNNST